jgi:hypothetical protein
MPLLRASLYPCAQTGAPDEAPTALAHHRGNLSDPACSTLLGRQYWRMRPEAAPLLTGFILGPMINEHFGRARRCCG